MPTVAQTVDTYLQAIFSKNDPIYKSFISNSEGVPEALINNPMDFNIGVFAGFLEWNRQLTLNLIDQLDLTKAEGKFLNFLARELIKISRFAGESDAEWVTRIQAYTIRAKVSPASIIFHTRPFSTTEPIIQEGPQDGAFAGLSFAGISTEFRNETPGQEFDHFVFPAISINTEQAAYFFILILTETDPADIPKLFDLMDRWVAGGVQYEIRINS